MILQKGFIKVSKLFYTREKNNPFFRTRMKNKGDHLLITYQYLCSAANIGLYKNHDRGWLEITYREIAKRVGISLRTVMNYLKKLVALGFILINPKVNKARSEKTLLFVRELGGDTSEGKQDDNASLYNRGEENRLLKPTKQKPHAGASGRTKKTNEFRRLQYLGEKTLNKYCEALERSPHDIASYLSPDDRIIIRTVFKEVKNLERQITSVAMDPKVKHPERLLSWRIANRLSKYGFQVRRSKLIVPYGLRAL